MKIMKLDGASKLMKYLLNFIQAVVRDGSVVSFPDAKRKLKDFKGKPYSSNADVSPRVVVVPQGAQVVPPGVISLSSKVRITVRNASDS